ncbi:hypothetical protein [Roseimaritima ulvae]|uniref:Uncharacterized protein n=1 Tax=Roseimaritima ulvae TaxID=980254 RepID=A0A5B9QXT6_9BACT|nr:hypothetical protein [Roseimaritima ulvae]QEG38771.1 hypothetical protein UC8_07290 [Roseimaritima ulvae]
MLLPESSEFHGQLQGSWEALGEGAPTLSALAAVCARGVVDPPTEVGELSGEAEAILYAAKDRGVIEVRGVRTAFEAPARLLAIYVELDEHRTIAFRNREDPQVTVRFFDGFCQLCRSGFILHHLHRDFSLSKTGFEAAGKIDKQKVESLLGEATEFGLHD